MTGIDFMNEEWRRHDRYFLMACNHLVDIGWRNALNTTDADIAEMTRVLEEREAKMKEENPHCVPMMTVKFQVWLMEVARAITQNVSLAEFWAWIEANKPFDCKGVKKVVK